MISVKNLKSCDLTMSPGEAAALMETEIAAAGNSGEKGDKNVPRCFQKGMEATCLYFVSWVLEQEGSLGPCLLGGESRRSEFESFENGGFGMGVLQQRCRWQGGSWRSARASTHHCQRDSARGPGTQQRCPGCELGTWLPAGLGMLVGRRSGRRPAGPARTPP